jgi:hypothetical protein
MQEIFAPTSTQFEICKRLGQYRFMTSEQLFETKVNSSKRNLYNILQTLRESSKPLIGYKDFGSLPSVGRLPIVYYLTKRGAEALEYGGISPDKAQYPRTVTHFMHDYFHRMACVDFYIMFDAWLRQNLLKLDFFNAYYHQNPTQQKKMKPHTTIHYQGGKIMADCIFSFTDKKHTSRLCFFELHRGHNDNRRLYRQIKQYNHAIQQQALENAFDCVTASRVLLVFEKENDLAFFFRNNSIKSLGLTEKPAPRFYLSTLEMLKKDFLGNWFYIPTNKKDTPQQRLLFNA